MNKKTLGAIVAIVGIGAALGSRAYCSYKVLTSKKEESESDVPENSDFDLNDVLNESNETSVDETEIDNEDVLENEKQTFDFDKTINELSENTVEMGDNETGKPLDEEVENEEVEDEEKKN